MKLHPYIIMLSTVQTNQTSIEKALFAVLEESGFTLPNDRVKAVAKMANCDMSVALNLLRMTPKLRKSMLAEDATLKDLSDTNLFHRLGKIMYNKSRRILTQERTSPPSSRQKAARRKRTTRNLYGTKEKTSTSTAATTTSMCWI